MKTSLTYDEAADLLNVSARTIRLAVARGEIPATHFNSRVVRIEVFDLRIWKERQTCRKSAQVGRSSAF